MNKKQYKEYIRLRLHEENRRPDKSIDPHIVSVRLPGGKRKSPTGEDALLINPTLTSDEQLEKMIGRVKRRSFTTISKKTKKPTTRTGYLIPPDIRAITDPQEFSAKMTELLSANIEHRLERMETLPELAERSQMWYVGAHNLSKRLGKKYGHPLHVTAAVIATQSPQTDWYMNASLGERIIHIHRLHQNTKWSKKMSDVASRGTIFKKTGDSAERHQKILKAIQGKTLGELVDPVHKAAWIRTYDEAYHDRSHAIITPEGDYGPISKTLNGKAKVTKWQSFTNIAHAVSILDESDRNSRGLTTHINNTISLMDVVSENLGSGHKVRSFYNNILQPNHPKTILTVDTHAGRVGYGRDDMAGSSQPIKDVLGKTPANKDTGQGGFYALLQGAHEPVARSRGMIPNALQSVVWDGIRADNASKKQKQEIFNLHVAHANGAIDHHTLLAAVTEILGPQKVPSWANITGKPKNPVVLPESYKDYIRKHLNEII